MKKRTVIVLILAVVLIALVPLFALPNAEFGGSDDAGNDVIAQVDSSFEPIASPLIENILGKELPGEVESLFFCVQTGIGVGIMSFFMGRFYERSKHEKSEKEKK